MAQMPKILLKDMILQRTLGKHLLQCRWLDMQWPLRFLKENCMYLVDKIYLALKYTIQRQKVGRLELHYLAKLIMELQLP